MELAGIKVELGGTDFPTGTEGVSGTPYASHPLIIVTPIISHRTVPIPMLLIIAPFPDSNRTLVIAVLLIIAPENLC